MRSVVTLADKAHLNWPSHRRKLRKRGIIAIVSLSAHVIGPSFHLAFILLYLSVMSTSLRGAGNHTFTHITAREANATANNGTNPEPDDEDADSDKPFRLKTSRSKCSLVLLHSVLNCNHFSPFVWLSIMSRLRWADSSPNAAARAAGLSEFKCLPETELWLCWV